MDLSLLPPVFSLILTVALRLFHPYSTEDKTSRLIEERFHDEGHPEGSLSYMEKRRGRKEIELTRRRRGGFKKREKDLAKSQFPKCFLQPRIPKEIHRVG